MLQYKYKTNPLKQWKTEFKTSYKTSQHCNGTSLDPFDLSLIFTSSVLWTGQFDLSKKNFFAVHVGDFPFAIQPSVSADSLVCLCDCSVFLCLSWTGLLPSMPGSSRPFCQIQTHPRWLTLPGAQSAAGAWRGSTATHCPLNWGLWLWTSSPTAGTTTTSGSQRTWSVLAHCLVGKTPVRWERDRERVREGGGGSS